MGYITYFPTQIISGLTIEIPSSSFHPVILSLLFLDCLFQNQMLHVHVFVLPHPLEPSVSPRSFGSSQWSWRGYCLHIKIGTPSWYCLLPLDLTASRPLQLTRHLNYGYYPGQYRYRTCLLQKRKLALAKFMSSEATIHLHTTCPCLLSWILLPSEEFLQRLDWGHGATWRNTDGEMLLSSF